MPQQPLTFELECEEIPVEIGGKTYVLVELDGLQRDKYLNGMRDRLRTNAKGEVGGIKNFVGLHADLLVESLRLIEDDVRKPVDAKTIQAWPARVVSGLFDVAQKLSRLDAKKDEDEPGND